MQPTKVIKNDADFPAKDQDFFQAQIGNDAPVAIREIEKYGIAMYRVVDGSIRTQDQETAFEDQIKEFVGQLILDHASGTINLAQFVPESNAVNEPLFLRMKQAFDPVLQLLRPCTVELQPRRLQAPTTIVASNPQQG